MDIKHVHHHAHHVEHDHDGIGEHDHLFDHSHEHTHPAEMDSPHDAGLREHEGHHHEPELMHIQEMNEHHAPVANGEFVDPEVETETLPKPGRYLWYGEE